MIQLGYITRAISIKRNWLLPSLVTGSTERIVLSRMESKGKQSYNSNNRCSMMHTFSVLLESNKETDIGNSTVIDGLTASSAWRKGELSKVTNKFNSDIDHHDTSSSVTSGNGSSDKLEIDLSKPLAIDNDEEVQQMWKEMESRVTRRKSLTISEAKLMGKGVGRRNIRRTDEEAWLDAGLYPQQPDR